MVSAAPTVSAARTAMPSIAAESNAGEDRRAHTGSAVTRPTASPTGSRDGVDPRRAARRPRTRSRHAARACSAGTSDTNGLVGSPVQDDLHLGAAVEAGRRLRDDQVAVRPGQHGQQRGGPEQRFGHARRAAATCTTSSRPAAEARSRPSRARAVGSGGGDGRSRPAATPAAARPAGTPPARTAGCRAARAAARPSHSASSVGLPGLIASPWHQMRVHRARPPRRRSRRGRRPTTRPRPPPGRCRASAARRVPRERARRRPGRSRAATGSPPASRTSAASADAVASRTCPAAQRRGLRRHHLVAGGHDRHPRAGVHRHRGHAGRGQQPEVLGAQRPAGPGASTAPAATSSSARTSPSPGATGRVTSIVPGMVSAVYSTITTASAPSGSAAPVGIATHVPCDTTRRRRGTHPHRPGQVEVGRAGPRRRRRCRRRGPRSRPPSSGRSPGSAAGAHTSAAGTRSQRLGQRRPSRRRYAAPGGTRRAPRRRSGR